MNLSNRKRARPVSEDDIATSAVLSRSAEHKKRWKEQQKKGSMTQAGFLNDQDFIRSMPAPRVTNRIVSGGRQNPAFAQGGISKSVKQHEEAFTIREAHAMESERVVPLGSAQCQNIQPGQALFIIESMRESCSKTKTGDTDITATSNVNGLKKGDRAIFVGFARTANVTEGNSDGTGNRSTAHLSGIQTPIHQGWSHLPVMADLVYSMTPNAIKDPDGGSKPIPAVKVPGQPDDMFVPALHELDERIISKEQARLRASLDANKEFKTLFELDTPLNIGSPAHLEQIKKCCSELRNKVAEKLTGFEMFPSDCPAAAYLYWYGVERLLESLLSGRLGLASSGIGALVKDEKYIDFFMSKTDKLFLSTSEGLVDDANEREVKLLCDDDSKSCAILTKPGGVLSFVKLQLDGVTHTWNVQLRRLWVGKNLNSCNVGQETDILVRY